MSDIIEDDRQVASFYVGREFTTLKDSQYAIVFLWVSDGRSPFEQMIEFYSEIKPREYDITSVKVPNMIKDLLNNG